MRRTPGRGWFAAGALLALCCLFARADAGAATRVEARSADFVAVALVDADRMTIHVSRTIDNAPVRDAEVVVLLRGSSHPATAEADGGYSIVTRDLSAPGPAAVVFDVKSGPVHEQLKGTLPAGRAERGPETSSNARQLGWWVLNFAVCIGFLMLMSRRRKGPRD